MHLFVHLFVHQAMTRRRHHCGVIKGQRTDQAVGLDDRTNAIVAPMLGESKRFARHFCRLVRNVIFLSLTGSSVLAPVFPLARIVVFSAHWAAMLAE